MDVSSIPKKYGGELDFECGMMPSIDPEIRRCLDLKNPKLEELFLTGPTRWVDNEEGEMIALSVGSIDGKPHKEAVATMHSWAVRTATGSRTFQSQRTQPESNVSQPASLPPSAPESRPQSKDQVLPSTTTGPPPVQQAPAAAGSQPIASNAYQQPPPQVVSTSQAMPPPQVPPPSIQPSSQVMTQPATLPPSESVLPNGSVLKSQPAFLDGQVESQNGNAGAPQMIAMPPPTQLQRMETEYMTPATEPSELRKLQ